MATTPQSFAIHAQYTPVYHFFASPLALIFAVWTIVRFVQSPSADTGYFLVGALALLGVTMVSRLSPLRVQDRLIRHRPRRRVPQPELPALLDQVLANPSMEPKAIKAAIRDWRADYFRV